MEINSIADEVLWNEQARPENDPNEVNWHATGDGYKASYTFYTNKADNKLEVESTKQMTRQTSAEGPLSNMNAQTFKATVRYQWQSDHRLDIESLLHQNDQPGSSNHAATHHRAG